MIYACTPPLASDVFFMTALRAVSLCVVLLTVRGRNYIMTTAIILIIPIIIIIIIIIMIVMIMIMITIMIIIMIKIKIIAIIF